MTKAQAQLIDPRSVGLRTLDMKQPIFDGDAVERADDALEAMAEEMQGWLAADVERLQAARLAADAAGWTSAAQDRLCDAAHDLKGMGATYRAPLVSQLAASLCRLIETAAGQTAVQCAPALARAHVDAIRASARDKITSDEHPVGRAVLRELETRVADLGVAPR